MVLRLSQNGLHTDLSPEAQGEALRKAMAESARARAARAAAGDEADGDGSDGGDGDERLDAASSLDDASSLPFLDAPAPAAAHAERAPAAEMSPAEMERRGLHAQQAEMERLKAESERKIDEFEAQQKSVHLPRVCWFGAVASPRPRRSDARRRGLTRRARVAFVGLFPVSFFFCSDCCGRRSSPSAPCCRSATRASARRSCSTGC